MKVLHSVRLHPLGMSTLFVCCFGLLVACDVPQSQMPVTLSGATMGTYYQVKYFPNDLAPSASTVQSEIDLVLADIVDLMSTYEVDSEVSRFNRLGLKQWFVLSERTYQVLELAQQISADSQGLFDVTIGPLVDLWGFGVIQTGDKLPKASDIQKGLDRVGYQKLELNADLKSVRKLADVSIDLSAIAKGYAVDQVAQVLKRQGLDRFMVEIGGELAISGVKPNGRAWQVAIESPDVQMRRVHTVLRVRDVGIATSGDYRNYFEYEGQRYTHTLDPRSGYPVSHALASVTVIAASTVLADAWATALLAAGLQQAMALAQQHNLAAVFISRIEGSYVEQYSQQAKQYLLP